jgi:mycofactocin precursor
MTVTTAEPTPTTDSDQDAPVPDATAATTPLVTADLLVEDVSIDGMCGVY